MCDKVTYVIDIESTNVADTISINVTSTVSIDCHSKKVVHKTDCCFLDRVLLAII